jgi:hypothetical protein
VAEIMAEILDAFTKLAWPLIIALAVVAYRYEIRDILKRLSQVKKGKFLGQEIELEEKLDQLEETTEKAQEEVASRESQQPQSEPVGSQPVFQEEQLHAQKLEQQILNQARTSPKIGLMLLSAGIDLRVSQLLAASGWHKKNRATPYVPRHPVAPSTREPARTRHRLFAVISGRPEQNHSRSSSYR